MPTILAVNSGSSTIKFGYFEQQQDGMAPVFQGSAEGIGRDDGLLTVRDQQGAEVHSNRRKYSSQLEALQHVTASVRMLASDMRVDGVGHRVVHGGPAHPDHQRITPELLRTLERDVHFAPLHNPGAIALIEATERMFPHTPQIACFDTAFHRTLPEAAFRYALPDKFTGMGLRRYGFHGLSCESIVRSLGTALGKRTVIAHLGSGASLTAVLEGRSVDTSMGLTPTGGIVMGTRPGDLDPGVALFLMRAQSLGADRLEAMFNHESGLLALAGVNDMRQIESRAGEGDEAARLAIEIFCRTIAKTVAALAVVLGGLDLLVFSGGIGEHSALVRSSVCERLAFLGVEIEAASNMAAEPRLSSAASRSRVQIVPSREEEQIALHAFRLLSAG